MNVFELEFADQMVGGQKPPNDTQRGPLMEGVSIVEDSRDARLRYVG